VINGFCLHSTPDEIYFVAEPQYRCTGAGSYSDKCYYDTHYSDKRASEKR